MKYDVVIIGGPTASGKTKFAIRYAEKLNRLFGVQAEIINADSVQLYDELKIITAYPSPAEMAAVPHRLFGILPPEEKSSVAYWLNLAKQEIERLRQLGKIAIVCGGTGFYLNAIKNGISNIPEVPQEFRRLVLDKFNRIGREAFFEDLSRLDSDIVKTLHKNNTQRILRAYEVVAYTGRTLTSWWNDTQTSGYKVKQILIMPEKEKLHSRCIARINNMLQVGAIDEVNDFANRYPNYNGPLCKAIGYSEILKLIQEKISYQECTELMYVHTKQYAKRQITWFKGQML